MSKILKNSMLLVIVGLIILGIILFMVIKPDRKETIVTKKNTFNTYIQIHNGIEGYEEYKEKGWPDSTKYILNVDRSYCMGLDGEIVNSDLSWSDESKSVVLNSLESTNCYVYFDLK